MRQGFILSANSFCRAIGCWYDVTKFSMPLYGPYDNLLPENQPPKSVVESGDVENEPKQATESALRDLASAIRAESQLKTESGKQDEARHRENKKAQWALFWVQLLTFVATTAAFITAAIYAYIAANQAETMSATLREVRIQTDSARISAAGSIVSGVVGTIQAGISNKAAETSRAESEKALAESVAQSRTDQRAWVGIKSISFVDPPLREGSSLIAEVTIANSGRTPALAVKTLTSTGYLPSGAKIINPKYSPVGLPATEVLLPNVPFTTKTIPVRGNGAPIGIVSLDAIKEVKGGLYDFYVWGDITYRDVFYKEHFTKFCAFLNSDTLSSFRGCDTYNDAN